MSFSIPVSLIREWHYCPRVVYYKELTHYQVVHPAWVQQGKEFHVAESQLWKRRNLSRFNLQEGQCHHNLSVRDEKLALHGIVDMAIETRDAVYAAEFKMSVRYKSRGNILQVAAYAMLLEQHFGKPSPVSFLLGQGKALHVVEVDEACRESVLKTAVQIRDMLQRGLKPDSNATVTQCCNCQYLNHCNDRL